MGNSLFSQVARGIKHKLRTFTHNPYRKAGLSAATVKYIKHSPGTHIRSVQMLGAPFSFKNGREFINGAGEIFVEEIYKQLLPPNALIFDCGAHIGLSVVYLKHICPTAEIFAFEPDRQNFELLTTNVKSYNLQNVTCINKAIWTEDTTLHFAGGMDASSHIDNSKPPGSVTVEAVRLRNLMDRRINFLKMDIEGAEYAVMKDIEDKLPLVDSMFLEYHGHFSESHQLTELFSMLTRHRFTYYIQEAAKVYPTPFYRDGVTPPYDVQLNIYCFKDTHLPNPDRLHGK